MTPILQSIPINLKRHIESIHKHCSNRLLYAVWALAIQHVAACSTVVAQDHRRSRLPRCRGNDLECAAAGDHVDAVAGGIQACTENGTVPQIIWHCKLTATAALTLQL